MEETSKPCEERKSSFDGLGPLRKKSKVSELVSQVIGTQEVITRQSTSYFANLPYEVIVNIFKYLDFTTISKCALLCRRFYFASQDGLLYPKVSLRYSMDPRQLQSYVSKVTVPRKLKLEYNFFSKECQPVDYSYFNSQVIRLLKKCGEHIISLHIESCRSDDVLLLLSECRNLKKLQMWRCKSSFHTLPRLHNLVDLKCVFCDIPTLIVGELLKNNPQLRTLSLMDTTNLQTGTVADVIGNYNTELEKLYIGEKRKVRAKGLRSIARCSKLRILELVGGPFYCDPEDSLQHLAAGCPRLEKLSIYGWKGITDEKLEPLLQNCTQLKVVDLRGLNITIKSCKEAALSLPVLKSLDVYKCGMIKKTQLIQLKKEFPEIDIAIY